MSDAAAPSGQLHSCQKAYNPFCLTQFLRSCRKLSTRTHQTSDFSDIQPPARTSGAVVRTRKDVKRAAAAPSEADTMHAISKSDTCAQRCRDMQNQVCSRCLCLPTTNSHYKLGQASGLHIYTACTTGDLVSRASSAYLLLPIRGRFSLNTKRRRRPFKVPRSPEISLTQVVTCTNVKERLPGKENSCRAACVSC